MSPRARRSQRRRCGREPSAWRPKDSVDVLIEAAGAVCRFHLLTRRAQAWVRLRPHQDWYFLAGALIVDGAYADAFAQWMRVEGLIVGFAAGAGQA